MDELELRAALTHEPPGRELDAEAVLAGAKRRRARSRTAWVAVTATVTVAALSVAVALSGVTRLSAVPAATLPATTTTPTATAPAASMTPSAAPSSGSAKADVAAVRAFPLVATQAKAVSGDVTGPVTHDLGVGWRAVAGIGIAWADATRWCLRGRDTIDGSVPTTPPIADECQPWPTKGATTYLTTGNIDIQPGLSAPMAFLAFGYVGTADGAAGTVDGVNGYPGEVFTVAAKPGARLVLLTNLVPVLAASAADQLPVSVRLYDGGSVVAAYANTSTRKGSGKVPTVTPTPASQVAVPSMDWPAVTIVPSGKAVTVGPCTFQSNADGVGLTSEFQTSTFHMVATPNMDLNANRIQVRVCKVTPTSWVVAIAILAPAATKVLITHHATKVAASLVRFADHPDWLVSTYEVAPYAPTTKVSMPAGAPTTLDPDTAMTVALIDDPPAVTAWDANGSTVLKVP